MKKGDYLSTILRSKKTIFTLKDLALLWHESSTIATRVRLNYYVKNGDLYRIRKGFYAKDKNYNQLELAARILTPAYISFETVLVTEGVIFQYYEPIFIASYTSRKIFIDGKEYCYRKLKDEVLHNSTGILQYNEFSIATKERAMIDTLYINNSYYFDNVESMNWDLIQEILPIYQDDFLRKKVESIIQK